MSQPPCDSNAISRLLTVHDILNLHFPPPDERFGYGPDSQQFGELRLPKSPGPHPVAIVIHGGCWRAEYSLQFMASFAAALAKAGIATWNIEYRRVGNLGGGWPGTFEDVTRGAGYLRPLAQRYDLDLNRTVAVGHSAGGHLALWLASRKRATKPSARSSKNPVPLRGVVVLAGVSDLRAALRNCSCAELVPRLMGGMPEDMANRYNLASPAELLPLGVPQRLVHGALDASVPLKMSEDYTTAARSGGDNIRLTILPNAGHFELIAPGSSAWQPVLETIRALL
jgi:acetyl esterase/lipase